MGNSKARNQVLTGLCIAARIAVCFGVGHTAAYFIGLALRGEP